MKEAIFTKSISINLAEDTFEKIKEITDLQKISVSEWFRVQQNWHSILNRRKETMTVMKNKEQKF